MDKTYNKIVFVNNQEPDLDATNMNAISNAIDEIDNRVIALNETVEQDSEVITQHTEVIAQNTADIEALKRKPSGITLTSASPLEDSTAAGIAGLQARGKSEQYISKNLSDVIYGKYWTNASPALPDGIQNKRLLLTKPIVPNKTYNISFKRNYDADKSFGIYVRYVDDNFNVLGTINYTISANGTSQKMTLNHADATKCCIFFVCDAFTTELSSAITEIMLNEGSTALPYEPYTGTPSPDNPVPIVDASGVVEAHTINLCDGIENGNYNGAQKSDSVTRARSREQIKIKGGMPYIITFESTKSAKVTIRQFRSDNTEISQLVWVASGTILNADLECDSIVLIFKTDDNSNNPEAFISNVQIEQGTTASEYVEYQTNEINLSSIGIDLRSIPNTNIADTLTVKADGSGEWVQKVGVAAFNGGWSRASNGTFYIDGGATDGKLTEVASNYGFFGGIVNNATGAQNYPLEICIQALNGLRFLFFDSSIASADDFNELINRNPIVVYYELATPIIHTLTAEQVAAILALQTYAGTTIVESELDEVVVDYVGDTKGYIDSKFEYLYELIRSYHPEAQMMSLEDEPTADEEEEGENV